MTKQNRLEGMLIGSFLGDTLALGAHWIYDQSKIRSSFGEISGPVSPLPDGYHPGKKLGDFTHYGDQSLFLFDFLSQCQSFDEVVFGDAFEEFMSTYMGYKDHATKETLKHLSALKVYKGSSSDELGGAARMASVLYLFNEDPQTAVQIAIAQCQATHTHPLLLEVTGYLANVVLDLISGSAPLLALENHLGTCSNELKELYHSGKVLRNIQPEEAAIKLGQSCSVKHAFPLVIYFLHQNPLDFKKILCKNVMAGGDCAARGMVLGMILGAYGGQSQLPKSWCESMNAYDRIQVRL